MRIGRRGFLVATLGAGAAGLAGLDGLAGSARRAALTELAGRLVGSASSHDLGIEHLVRHPEAGGRRSLEDQLLRGRLAPVGVDPLALWLDARVREDFTEGRVEQYGGWVLAATELRLHALATLLAQPNDVTRGLFAPATFEDGTGLRWTAPRLKLAVPSEVSPLSLRIRNPAPFERRVAVSLDGRPADELRLAAGEGWVSLRYALAASAGRLRELEIDTSPPWSPPNDYRTIGLGLEAAGGIA